MADITEAFSEYVRGVYREITYKKPSIESLALAPVMTSDAGSWQFHTLSGSLRPDSVAATGSIGDTLSVGEIGFTKITVTPDYYKMDGFAVYNRIQDAFMANNEVADQVQYGVEKIHNQSMVTHASASKATAASNLTAATFSGLKDNPSFALLNSLEEQIRNTMISSSLAPNSLLISPDLAAQLQNNNDITDGPIAAYFSGSTEAQRRTNGFSSYAQLAAKLKSNLGLNLYVSELIDPGTTNFLWKDRMVLFCGDGMREHTLKTFSQQDLVKVWTEETRLKSKGVNVLGESFFKVQAMFPASGRYISVT